MATEKKRKLELTIAALQDRWGVRAIRRLGRERGRAIPHVPTGFLELDEALATGGLPRGRISEIFGAPTSGAATIALKVAANAQEEAGSLIYVDPGRSFDPEYAARCGLKLERMVLVRPYNIAQALAIMADFILGEEINLLIFDAPLESLVGARPAQKLAATLDRIIAPVGRSQCVLLFLIALPGPAAYPDHLVLPHYAALRLSVQREGWLYRRRDIVGYRAQVLVVKNKLGPAGQRVVIGLET